MESRGADASGVTVTPAEQAESCPWCGAAHASLHCPRVKAFEFDAAMSVTRVEFLTPADCVAPRRQEPTGGDEQQDYPKLKPLGGG